MGELYVVRKRRSTDFKALKLSNVRSGCEAWAYLWWWLEMSCWSRPRRSWPCTCTPRRPPPSPGWGWSAWSECGPFADRESWAHLRPEKKVSSFMVCTHDQNFVPLIICSKIATILKINIPSCQINVPPCQINDPPYQINVPLSNKFP